MLGVVVIGFNNAKGITRLLDSLSQIANPNNDSIVLIISIDYSGNNNIAKIAEDYSWSHGRKIVIHHTANLGLRQHILSCGNYIQQYKLEGIIVLEDDLYVSPDIYSFAKLAVERYSNDSRIAGISLYRHDQNILAKSPFSAIDDGYDNYFVQYAQSWGQVWTREAWNEFRLWYDNKGWESIDAGSFPPNILQWKESWLKYHIMYCISNNKYFVYPRFSQTTNFSDAGTHRTSSTSDYQVPIAQVPGRQWHLSSLDESLSVYDCYFENVALSDYLHLDNCVIDLYGIRRDLDKARFVLSTRDLPYRRIKTWGMDLRPIEMNVLHDVPGEEIILYDLSEKASRDRTFKKSVKRFSYHLSGRNVMTFDLVRFVFLKLVGKVFF